MSRGFATAPPNADDPATESHKAAKTGIPNRQKTGLEPRFLAKTITSNPRLRRGDQPLRDSSRATSYFHDAVVGHEIKSRADNTIIVNSRIQDGPTGTASYEIDLPNGGNALIYGNVIEQGPLSQNPVILSTGEEGNVYSNSHLTADFNTVLNDLTSSSVLAVRDSTATAEFDGNDAYGFTPGHIVSGLFTASKNTLLTGEPALITTHPWLG